MKIKKKFLITVLTLVIVISAVVAAAIVGSSAAGAPELEIMYNNLSLRDAMHIKYAVNTDGAEGVSLLVWNSGRSSYTYGTQDKVLTSNTYQTVNGTRCLIFELPGLAAKQMTEDYYVRAYVVVGGTAYYSDVQKYSILQYAYEVQSSLATTAEHKKVVKEMLDYGAYAQREFNYKLERLADGDYRNVTILGGTLSDTTTQGLYLVGDTVSLVAPATDAIGTPFSHWENSSGATVSSTATSNIELPAGGAEETYTAVYSAAATNSVLTFTQLSDGTYSVTAKSGAAMPETVVIPATYNSAKVTAIADNAFANCTGIENITIPASIQTIGKNAFYGCTNITRVTLPAGLKSIGTDAFEECYKLAEVINLSKIELTIGSNYNGCAAKYATEVHDGASKMVSEGDYLFYPYNGVNYLVAYVGNATTLTLPTIYNGGNYAIRQNAFRENASITKVTISSGVTTVGKDAFTGCSALATATLAGVTTLEPYAFSGTALKTVSLPATLTTVGEYAFKDCTKITILSISAGPKVLGTGAFYGCTSINRIISASSTLEEIGDYAFYGCPFTSMTLPNTVKKIGSNAFAGCTSLSTFTINSASVLESIGGSAFRGAKISTVNIPSGVKSIGAYAFADCTSLATVNCLGTSLKTIGDGAFAGCTALANITLNGSLEYVGVSVFTDTAYYADSTKWTGDVLYIGNCLVDVKDTISGSYSVASGTTAIAHNAFDNCASLTSVTLPSGIVYIGDCAFQYCSTLTSINFPGTIKTVGFYAFDGCVKLTAADLSATQIKVVGPCTFNACTALATVKFPTGLKQIAYRAFQYCSALKYVELPTGLELLGEWAFANTALNDIDIPVGITKIRNSFANCSNLTIVKIRAAATVSDNSFLDCANIRTVYYGGTEAEWKANVGSGNVYLTSAGYQSFYSATAPTSVGNYWRFLDGEVTAWPAAQPLKLPNDVSYSVAKRIGFDSASDYTLDGRFTTRRFAADRAVSGSAICADSTADSMEHYVTLKSSYKITGVKGVLFYVDFSRSTADASRAGMCASVTVNHNTYRANISGSVGYYYSDGEWIQTAPISACRMQVPHGFAGWVYIPVTSYKNTSTGAAGLEGVTASSIRLYTGNYKYQAGDEIVFDEVLFVK